MGVAVTVGAGIFSIGAELAALYAAGPAVVLSFLITQASVRRRRDATPNSPP